MRKLHHFFEVATNSLETIFSSKQCLICFPPSFIPSLSSTMCDQDHDQLWTPNPEASVSSSGPTGSLPPCVAIVEQRFLLQRRLGGGAFGEVYLGYDQATEGLVAIKLENLAGSMRQPHLVHEAHILAHLNSVDVTVGIPKLVWHGRERDFNVMVMELLGPTLEDLLDACGRPFDLKTVLMLAVQLIDRVEFVHEMGFIHRDLKPENFAMGLGKRSHHVYLIDYGLSRRYVDIHTKEHIPKVGGRALTGTARYVSINTHNGIQPTRRDDMEALANIFIYLARGALPWQGIRCPTKQEKYERIRVAKLNTSISQLCDGLPSCFADLLSYAPQDAL